MGFDDWQREVAVNLTGAFVRTQPGLPSMVEAGFGRVVNVSPLAGQLGGFGQAAYASTKAGIIGLTKTTALEHARDAVRANAVVPGLIDSPAADAIRDDVRERSNGRSRPAKSERLKTSPASSTSWRPSRHATSTERL